jgi:hypothetical protein
MAKKDQPKAVAVKGVSSKRNYVPQTEIPNCSLEEALRIPRALVEELADGPATPLQVASALNMMPTSGPFRSMCGSSIAYGLTSGGSSAAAISLEPRGRRAVGGSGDADAIAARREAILQPRVNGEFLRRYNGKSLPRPDIAHKVLVEMGVPAARADETYKMIVESAGSVGVLREIKDKQFVELGAAAPAGPGNGSTGSAGNGANGESGLQPELPEVVTVRAPTLEEADRSTPPVQQQRPVREVNRRVFITHGKNRSFIEPIKKILVYGEMEPVVSVEKETVSKSVPAKVMDDMRSCGAAIIHVDEEMRFTDQEVKEHVYVNQNVLIEIGAAMALYGSRYILLVKDGVRLPSNLQGLYEVRYKDDALDGDTTIRLMYAINDMKKQPGPLRYADQG